jgi:two-component sensor histidine kinase
MEQRNTGSRQAESWDESDLMAEIARLQTLLREAAAEIQIGKNNASESESRHASELGAERSRTKAARSQADESEHRVKNTLATVSAIANATLRPDVPYEQARAAFNSRLQALAHVQDMLFKTNWSDAKLKSLIDGIIAPHAASRSGRIRVRGPETTVRAEFALVLALALNELATNAVKYGALSNGAGYVEIAWTQQAEFHLRWHERNGPPVTPPSRKGFGSRLIQDTLPAQFNGTVELEFEPGGLICTMRMPAEKSLAIERPRP